MPSKAPKLMATLGIVGLVHAAISAAQHRSYLRLTEQDFTVLPLDIIFQSVLCLLITMYGTMCIAGDFKEVRATVELESKSFETFGNRPSFYMFCHRGRALASEPVRGNTSMRIRERR
ncbi:ER membrane protein complex subunit 5 [Dermacentor albipictus]|uniref:ER membrane protein complex subunit 5 n=1 Tax=Dermacentor albipictus TaxID=60249 RepID=UPI0038FD0808